MKLFTAFLIVFSVFCAESFAREKILKISDNLSNEVDNILDAITNVRKEVDGLLDDVKSSQVVYKALDSLSKNNLTVCLEHCKRSTSEDQGANIKKAIDSLHESLAKFGGNVDTRIETICDCAAKKFHVDITPETFKDADAACVDEAMTPLPGKLKTLIESVTILERFLNNITNRIQFDCLINLMGQQTPDEKQKGEQLAVACLNEISKTLYPTCKPMNDKIFADVKDIKDYMGSMMDNLKGCVDGKMEIIRKRLIQEKKFDFNLC